MPQVFICYRRDDTAPYAGRLHDRLSSEFGADRVFMDLDAIAPGQLFEERIRNALDHSDVVVAVIGRHWLSADDATGQPRLHSAQDHVRREIGMALEKRVHMIPTLVGRAELPRSDRLPLDLQELLKFQVIELSDQRWGHDVGQLILAINRATPRSRAARVRRSLTKNIVWPIRILTPLVAIGGLQLLNSLYERFGVDQTYRLVVTLLLMGVLSTFVFAVERRFRDDSRR